MPKLAQKQWDSKLSFRITRGEEGCFGLLGQGRGGRRAWPQKYMGSSTMDRFVTCSIPWDNWVDVWFTGGVDLIHNTLKGVYAMCLNACLNNGPLCPFEQMKYTRLKKIDNSWIFPWKFQRFTSSKIKTDQASSYESWKTPFLAHPIMLRLSS